MVIHHHNFTRTCERRLQRSHRDVSLIGRLIIEHHGSDIHSWRLAGGPSTWLGTPLSLSKGGGWRVAAAAGSACVPVWTTCLNTWRAPPAVVHSHAHIKISKPRGIFFDRHRPPDARLQRRQQI